MVSTAVFETWDFLKRLGSGYSALLYRVRLGGVRRVVIDLIDDGFTFGVLFAFVLLAYALPPFSGTGDVWNRGREYAVTFTDANGEIIGRRGIRQDDAIPLEDFPPHIIKAVLATEDARFFEHFGVDVIGTFRAIIQNARANDVVQGGSSLTQQVAKNLFLWPGRSLVRKALELPLSLWIDLVLGKQRVLEIYLNIAELGPSGQFGAGAGAAYAFGRPASELSPREAALLAAILPNPVRRSARNPRPGVRRLAVTYMARAQASALKRCWGGNRGL